MFNLQEQYPVVTLTGPRQSFIGSDGYHIFWPVGGFCHFFSSIIK
jgi:hypothetical protein